MEGVSGRLTYRPHADKEVKIGEGHKKAVQLRVKQE